VSEVIEVSEDRYRGYSTVIEVIDSNDVLHHTPPELSMLSRDVVIEVIDSIYELHRTKPR
jgi:hypothetical protein